MQLTTKQSTKSFQTRPKVSVCLASFNGELYIIDQVNSILVQLESSDELVISDNGSTDNTLEIISKINDRRIRLVHCKKKGVCNNFENAITSSTGDVLILSDQDDVWLPGRLAVALKALQSSDLSLVNFKSVDAKLNVIKINHRQPKDSVPTTLLVNGYTGCCMAMNKVVLNAILPFPKGLPMHDWWIAILCQILFDVKINSEAYILYRRHGSNLSSTGGVSAVPLLKRLSWRFIMLRLVLSRVVKIKFFSGFYKK